MEVDVSVVIAKPEHEVAYNDLIALIGKHSDTVSKQALLAIAANMVGKLVALQDQRELTPAQAMEVVAKNLELGNQSVIRQLLEETGGAA